MVRVIDQNDQFPSHLFPTSGSNSDYIPTTEVSACVDQQTNLSFQAFICILTDLTDASNTCRKHVINLSGSYTIEHLIREAADFYSYDPFSFNLFWVANNDMVNLSDIKQTSLTLIDLGLTTKKNTFEIHEKEDGPPRRIYKQQNSQETFTDEFGYKSSTLNSYGPDNFDMLEPISYTNIIEDSLTCGTYPPRRNAVSNQTDASTSSMGLTLPKTFYDNSDEVNTGFVGLINQAMTCYLNSLLQTLYMTPEFRNGIYRWKSSDLKHDNDDGKKNIPLQLQRLFLNLQTSTKKSIQTHDLTKSFGWNSEDAFQQHDVQELSRVMFDALEKMFKDTEQKNLINELYQGKVKDYVKCLECDTENARVDVYLDVPLCIRPFGSDKTFESVEEALDAFIQPEILDENNKYFCSKCNKMCKAHKGLKFESFPYILSLQLKRFDFDYNTMSRFKLSNSVTFPELLNVKKYLDSYAAPKYPANPQESENLTSELTETNESLNEEAPTNEDALYDYELFSIMIHSGSATGGHYYAYIKCIETNQWYNFNDEKVTKLDRYEICKAFGTSYSMYSSATAYMLLYRQVNPKRNEKFIKPEEFSEHIKESQERFKKQQIEADILKEYMDNMCKVKVIAFGKEELEFVEEEKSHLKKRNEKSINIHKDFTLDKAKMEIIKEFDLLDHMESTNKKSRLLKYDTYNDLIEQSYKSETDITVFEAVGFTKFPYNFCWYLELLPNEQDFTEYNSSDYKMKVFNLNLKTFEAVELFNIRLKDNSRVACLQKSISEKLGIEPQSIRMALEKTHAVFNYMYLNDNMGDLLKSLNFSKVSKIFIESEEKPDTDTNFENSLFCYALDAIANMIHMTVYLPNDDQCESFKMKTKRRLNYIELQNQLMQKSKILKQHTPEEENSSENSIKTTNLLSAASSGFPMSNESEYLSVDNQVNYDVNDTSSKMSFQFSASADEFIGPKWLPQDARTFDQTNYDEFDSNMVENHFRSDEISKKTEHMETSLEDEGIGSSTKTRSTTSLETLKPDSSATKESFTSSYIDNQSVSNEFVNYEKNKLKNIFMEYSHGDDSCTKQEYMENSNNTDDDDDVDNETHLGDVVERCDVDLADLDSEWTDVDNVNTDINIDDDTNLLNDDYNGDNASNELNEINANSLFNFDSDYSTLYGDSSALTKQRVKFYDSNIAEKPFEDENRKDDKLKLPDSLNIFSGPALPNNSNESVSKESLKTNSCESRFIKSTLSVNEDLGTRILEISMDKRINLTEFKTHVKDYLQICNENFRVFRICQNDVECELTSHENQFSYLTQNTKFLIKLGPPLKYGEYVLPVFKLNKSMGSISYLCDFMIVHGLSVLNHKELLNEDLKDECNIEIDVEKMRLRKKISKRPGNILLNNEVFGKDIFVNPTSELCIEVLDEPEKKSDSKLTISVYLRHWKSDEYELGDLFEIIVNGNTFENLLDHVSSVSGIPLDELEVLKCKRDYPFKSPILDIHRDPNWKSNFYLQMEKLEDGACFYYRNKKLDLGTISEEKRRDMVKTDNINFRSTSSYTSRKEKGVRIQVENN